MSIFSIFLTGLALSMDAFAVSVSNGICWGCQGSRLRQALATALAFGLFQGIMPLLGYAAGSSFADFIDTVDHWVAFGLLLLIGGKMVVEGLQELRRPEACPTNGQLTLKLLLLQAVATSIDALAIGVGMAMLHVNIWLAAGLIACTTFICCLVGYLLGSHFGKYLKNGAVIAGGLVLVGIGLKILLEGLGIL